MLTGGYPRSRPTAQVSRVIEVTVYDKHYDQGMKIYANLYLATRRPPAPTMAMANCRLCTGRALRRTAIARRIIDAATAARQKAGARRSDSTSLLASHVKQKDEAGAAKTLGNVSHPATNEQETMAPDHGRWR